MLTKRLEKKFFSMINTKCKTSEDMNDKLQSLKNKTKSKVHKKIAEYYEQMNYMRH